MQNNPLNSVSIKENFNNKQGPKQFKLSLLKPKSKTKFPKKSRKFDGSQTPKTINDEYSLNEEDAELEQLIFKTKKVKLESVSDDNSDITKLIYENGTERYPLLKPSKIRKRSEADTATNISKTVLNSPQSLVESDKVGDNTEISRLIVQTTEKKVTPKSSFSKTKSIKINQKEMKNRDSIVGLDKNYDHNEKHAKRDKLIVKQKTKQREEIKTKLTIDNAAMQSNFSLSKLIDEHDKKVNGTEMSQLSVKQLKKRQRSESDSCQLKTPKKVCKKELNTSESIADLADITETSKIINENCRKEIDSNLLDHLNDKPTKKRKRKIKSKAIIDEHDLKNDADSSRVINENGIVVEQPKEKEILYSSKKIGTNNIVNNSESMIENLNEQPQLSESIMTNNGLEKTSISINENCNYKEYTKQNQLIVQPTESQGSIIKSKFCLEDAESNKPDTLKLIENNDKSKLVEQPKKRGRPKLSLTQTIKKAAKSTSNLIDKIDKSQSTEQPKKRGRPRLNSSTATTPKNVAKKGTKADTSILFEKDGKQESIEQPKKRGRPRLDSIKATTPKKDTNEKFKKSESIVIQNDHTQSNEVLSNNSELDNFDINAENNSETHEAELGKGRPKVTTTNSYITRKVTPRTASKTLKINLAKTKKAMLKPNGKITKESLKATSFRKIPQNRLENALEMLRNEDHPVWEDHNISCNTGIHRYWEPRNCIKSDRNLKIKYARQFLLRRDWINLSKVLSLSTSYVNTNRNNHYYPLLTKYATLCLAHTDKEQFNKFVQFLVGMDDGNSTVMKTCTNIIKDNVE